MYSDFSWNFLGLSSSETNFKKAMFVIIPTPYDSTSSYRSGSRHGPRRIIEASSHLELFDLELEQEPYTKGVYTFGELEQEPYTKGVYTFGEIEPVRGDVVDTIEKICITTSNVINHKKIPILIGGEHTITLGAIQAFQEDCIIVDFDAHADLRDSYQGDYICHATVMRRVLEEGKKIVEIGVRSMSEEEFNYAKENEIPIFTREYIRNTNIDELIDDLRSKIDGRKTYLSIDVDVLDPSEAPGVSTPEPDGLTFWKLKELIKIICKYSKIIGADLVEVTPINGNNITEFLGASVIYKIIGYV
jgi:agmatinase